MKNGLRERVAENLEEFFVMKQKEAGFFIQIYERVKFFDACEKIAKYVIFVVFFEIFNFNRSTSFSSNDHLKSYCDNSNESN